MDLSKYLLFITALVLLSVASACSHGKCGVCVRNFFFKIFSPFSSSETYLFLQLFGLICLRFEWLRCWRNARRTKIATPDSIVSTAWKDFQAINVWGRPLQTNSSFWYSQMCFFLTLIPSLLIYLISWKEMVHIIRHKILLLEFGNF